MTRFDPSRGPIYWDRNDKKQHLFGWYGPFPWEPCRECGGEEFQAVDWNLGYWCTSCRSTFGTRAEWGYIDDPDFSNGE